MNAASKASMPMFIKRHYALLGVGLVLARALGIVFLPGDTLRYIDEQAYQEMAQVLIQQHAFLDEGGGPTALRPPGYPLVIALTYLIAERPLAVKCLNALLL